MNEHQAAAAAVAAITTSQTTIPQPNKYTHDSAKGHNLHVYGSSGCRKCVRIVIVIHDP